MAGGGGGGKGGQQASAGAGFPIGMFANPMGGGGMYGVDPSADPQFVDASSLTDPLSTVGAALGGGDLFGGGAAPGQGPQAADIGGSQSDPNSPGAIAAAGQKDEGALDATGTSALSKIAEVLNPINSAHAEAGPVGPHWFEGGKGDREDKLPEAASAPLRLQTQQGGPYANLQGPYSPPIEGGTAPVPGQDAAPTLTSRVPGPAPGMPGQPPPAPQEPQPAAVEPQAPRRREAAATPPAASAAPPPPSPTSDPISALFHALGLDALIRQVGGDYNLPQHDQRNQQYGLPQLLQGIGRGLQVVGGQKPRPWSQPQRSAYAPTDTGYVRQPGGPMSEASPYYGTRRPQTTQTTQTYNPQIYTRAVASIESGGNPRDRTGSNVGLYSMGPQEIRQYGDPNDPRSLARETAHHTQVLRTRLGRDPQPWELYLTHQQGIAGGPALLAANPNMPAWQAVRRFYKSDAIAKSAIKGNAKWGELANVPAEGITAGMFTNWWEGRFNRALARAGGGTQMATPPTHGARQANNGKWYIRDRNGKYREVYAD